MSHCDICGGPIEDARNREQHHNDQQRGNNDPDNLRSTHRRCHHSQAHDNKRATDERTSEKYGPRKVRGGPARPNTGPF